MSARGPARSRAGPLTPAGWLSNQACLARIRLAARIALSPGTASHRVDVPEAGEATERDDANHPRRPGAEQEVRHARERRNDGKRKENDAEVEGLAHAKVVERCWVRGFEGPRVEFFRDDLRAAGESVALRSTIVVVRRYGVAPE